MNAEYEARQKKVVELGFGLKAAKCRIEGADRIFAKIICNKSSHRFEKLLAQKAREKLQAVIIELEDI